VFEHLGGAVAGTEALDTEEFVSHQPPAWPR
jgi:hypothetical protein